MLPSLLQLLQQVRRPARATLLALFAFVSTTAAGEPALTLEKIMANPDWIGAPVESPYWGTDGRDVYYRIKRSGSPITDLHRVQLSDGNDRVVTAAEAASADGPTVWDSAGKQAAFVRNGDLFVRDPAHHALRQITRSLQSVSAPQFSGDGRLLSFRLHQDWFVHDLKSGLTWQAATLRLEKDPGAPPKPDPLHAMQLRGLFDAAEAT